MLPAPPAAVGRYDTWVRTGDLVVTSGRLPWENGVMRHPGRLGEQVSIADGKAAARLATLNGICREFSRVRSTIRHSPESCSGNSSFVA